MGNDFKTSLLERWLLFCLSLEYRLRGVSVFEAIRDGLIHVLGLSTNPDCGITLGH